MIFDSTKERLTELEKEKSELEITILQEQIKKPFLTKDQIRFGIEKFKELDITTKEGKERLNRRVYQCDIPLRRQDNFYV